ncbi:type II toxin-antitoxin system RelE/ParE family toxin [Methylobacterium sp. J-077]|uniref:type II toxin-antitoxin system RelE/ParE family toxin n=1 Tax=Methylobacterium sp. J-077 TaxID=2836656 RepID=UPI001FBBE82B|nr:type II toxin-antitoxin system RelE/ParE family toxin [Methylobacterium sp. J-077]MCJ2125595.1 type II toxin-antitoxin system RelE/ParE family toxin [Methylobacterium sp. J-077]
MHHEATPHPASPSRCGSDRGLSGGSQSARRTAVETAIQAALVLIGRYPEIGPMRRRRVRRFALPRYPYLIFYRLDASADAIAILAIRHASRKPGGPS